MKRGRPPSGKPWAKSIVRETWIGPPRCPCCGAPIRECVCYVAQARGIPIPPPDVMNDSTRWAGERDTYRAKLAEEKLI